ncbi:cation:proton antiporter [Phaeobacter gallaeciensis]|jgi:multicomponent K+:H+ antiporter subunit E|uniref:Cation:proton antiporter n=1 Tax=Phaeobacter gallaeciensis TaxID=60890 RepID=A0A1B0ZMR0_9RHOB|nr:MULTISPECIES: Na+/H+ antiporter subunit E [Phaeobacter]MDF1771116.1 Na+/H+ antiporter subunit E [Pseudophaeobacter sp. bin_em_oilr2.035]MEE2635359.1 Na+/H+ antiporter subunit E [Pseudomonadota bacterium]ANP35462.1 cation:proton antiporter [Phaeobacter gallaeciensis]MDE4061991.1 Na+/H+ antiporter subunit E [Phaeobacter gallaeciensis]MDE4125062.1 Na+/H+ antiporter subunit E [Phaeobacter gallaeciensis]
MKLMHRLLPHPVLTLLLTLTWVLIVNSFTLNSLVFGFLLGLLIPFLTQPFWPQQLRMKHPVKIAAYILIVIWDIVVANITVARIVVFKSNAKRQPNWVTVPLELRTPEAITVLAGTITMTPGTVTADVSAEGHALLVHCLDCDDPDAVRDEIKERYERRLMEIFE